MNKEELSTMKMNAGLSLNAIAMLLDDMSYKRIKAQLDRLEKIVNKCFEELEHDGST